ncbi:hypothetical protein ACG1VR_12060 [Cedecea davisae]|uniref:hypothetical protein n=1 Tax=Cedecea davisae TaxID=158484 RepID=UPI00376F1F4A
MNIANASDLSLLKNTIEINEKSSEGTKSNLAENIIGIMGGNDASQFKKHKNSLPTRFVNIPREIHYI